MEIALLINMDPLIGPPEPALYMCTYSIIFKKKSVVTSPA